MHIRISESTLTCSFSYTSVSGDVEINDICGFYIMDISIDVASIN